MTRKTLFPIGVLMMSAALVLGGCAGGFGGRAGGQVFAVGDNLLGEPCRASLNPSLRARLGAGAAYDVQCGNWEQASARVSIYQKAQTDGRLPMAWRQGAADWAVCDESGAGGLGADGWSEVIECSLSEGGWPYQARLYAKGGRLYVIDGIPAALEAGERTAAVLSGDLSPSKAAGGRPASRELERLRAEVGAQLFSAGDVVGFQSLLRLARHFNYQGNHVQAAAKYREALTLQQRILPGDRRRQGQVLMHLALELSNQELFGQAETLFGQAERALISSMDPTDLPRLVSYRALHAANQQQFERALDLAQRASAERLSILETFSFGGFNGATASGLMDGSGLSLNLPFVQTAYADLVQSRSLEAAMLRRLDRPDEALALLNETERLIDQNPTIPGTWRSRLLLLKAEIAEDEERLFEAIEHLNRVVLNERALSVDSRVQATALMAIGRLRFEAGDRPGGFAASVDAFDILARTDAPVQVDQLVPFLDAVLALPADDPRRDELISEAFQVAQLARTPLIAQSIGQTLARVAAKNSDGSRAIRTLQDLRRQRDDLVARLTTAYASPETLGPQIEVLEGKLDAVKAQINRTELTVQSALPTYNVLLDRVVGTEELGQVLTDQETVVQFLVAEGALYGFLLDKAGHTLFRTDLTRADTLGLLEALRYPVDEAPGAAYDLDLAQEGYNLLFGPIDSRIRDKQRLIVVPSGPLLSLPFSMLVTPDNGASGRNYSSVSWLIKRQAIAVLPSVQSLYTSRTVTEGQADGQAPVAQAGTGFVGFSGETYDHYDPETLIAKLSMPPTCRKDVELLANLAPLSGAAEEIQSIARTVGEAKATTLRLSDFSEQSLKAFDFSTPKVVHFATHGLLPGDLDCWPEPALVLGSREEDSNEDGLLTASEVSDLVFENAQLVILSACNTGALEDQYGGEGLASLTRTFLYAGARGLVVSHWSVSDEATRDLMVGFFQYLSDGQPVVDAMRQAKLDLIARSETAHPYYWSAFSTIGDGAFPVRL